ncbi:MAG: hypothetical protein RL367_1503 [Pseudomonadota bacterium]
MATYLLVHGAWGGSASWFGIAKQLTAKGHDVHLAALTGLGERAHLLTPAISLTTHVTDVVAMIDYRGLNDIILVGHSYGGMVITATAAKRSDQIKSMVYVDAFLPRDGEALWDIADDPSRNHYIDAQRDQPGLVAPFPGSPPGLGRHPLLTLTEPAHLSGDHKCIARHSYVYATRGAPTVFTKFYDRIRADPEWQTHALDTGHGVMIDDPDGMLKILLGEAG